MEKNGSYSHILKYTGIFGGIQGLGILVGIVRNKCVAMLLGPEGMGLMALFNSTIKLISDSTNLGIAMSAVKNMSVDYDSGAHDRIENSIKLIRSWSLLTALMGMLLCIVLSPLLNRWTFTWGDHTVHFILLSPVVALMGITAGETAILKGTRHLRRLAYISIYNVIGSLLMSVPIFYFFGESGIVPSLIIVALLQCIVTITYSWRLFPLKISFSYSLLGEGVGMVRLGIAFVCAGILGSGADFIIRSYLNTRGSLDVVGLFNAGFMMTMTYAGMVFSAMETDYFPRLSAICTDREQMNITVNRQIEVSLLLIAPMLVAFIIAMPILLPLLYSGKFLPVLGMMQVTVLAMYLRAVKLPVAYIPLARGDSRVYLIMEGIYDVVLVLLVIFGYNTLGLLGTGVAILVAALFDFVMLVVFMRIKYGYVLSGKVIRYSLLQMPIGVVAYGVTFVDNTFLYWGIGALLTLLSAVLSVNILKQKTSLWASLCKRLHL